MRFSNRYKGFNDWLSTMDRRTGYTQRISRLHNLYSKATLDQLRGHARIKTAPKPLYTRSWSTLSPKERLIRERALEVLSNARKSGKSLHRLSREHKISSLAVRKATRGFRKVKGLWKANRSDRISRIMAINEHGMEIFIEVASSRQASIIGRYQAAVKEYLNTGNVRALERFKGKKVKDASGAYHTLETDPDAIRDINERREEPEFYDIYKLFSGTDRLYDLNSLNNAT